MLKRTPLFEIHQKLGARLVEFGGWEMPVQYTGIVDEHHAVRNAAGVFDICHMGEMSVTGPEAETFLNHLLTNDIRKAQPGNGQYTLMCNSSGGVVDDLYAYRLGPTQFLLIINASRIEPDVAWMKQCLASSPWANGVALEDISGRTGAVALQGPKSREFVDAIFEGATGADGRPTSALKKNEVHTQRFQGTEIVAASTGYTGEDGFEFVAAGHLMPGIWNRILECGQAAGCKPAGLGARDTLRTEACYPLYGHELDEQTTPIEAGVGFFVSLDKGEFNGRSVVAEQKQNGPAKRCVAFRMTGKTPPPRPGYTIFAPGGAARLGTVASGTQSPSLACGIGLGYVPTAAAIVGGILEIEIRGTRHPAVIVKKPFYSRGKSSS